MSRRSLPGVMLAVLALGVMPVVARAEDPASLEALVQRSLAADEQTSQRAAGAIASPALAGPVDPATYRLGPGDRLVVHWTGRVTRSETAEVGPTGDLFLAEVGGLNVAGRTLADASMAILEQLRRVTRDVRVEVQLVRPRVFRVFRSGAVLAPGPTETVGGTRVSDVLGAETLLPEASHRDVRVVHRDGTQERADLERVLRLGDHSRDPWLLDGDALVVPVASRFVQVTGAVVEPGRIELASDDSVRTLLLLAGGLLPEAVPEEATWIHWRGETAETLRVDVNEVLAGRAGGALAHGDHVYVRARPDYRRTGQVRLEGDVAHPGSYPVAVSGTRLGDVIEAAGGFLPSADRTGIRLRRPRTAPEADDPDLAARMAAAQRDLSVSDFEVAQARLARLDETIVVDWDALRRSPQALDPLLHDGDEVTVPRLVRSLRIDGQVANPGLVHYEPGTPLRRYIEQAGGYTARAWRGHEQVTRAGADRARLAKVSGEPRPGDFVWVPTRPEDSIWRKSRDVLSALAQVATIVIAIRSVR